MRIILPYPPSMNHYWRTVGGRVLISREGRIYRHQAVAEFRRQVNEDPLTDRLAVHLEVYPPDRRRRDLDNVQKPLLDALGHAGVFGDDSQIDWLLTERMVRIARGRVVVTIEPRKVASDPASSLEKTNARCVHRGRDCFCAAGNVAQCD